jgi:hypothetical protein
VASGPTPALVSLGREGGGCGALTRQQPGGGGGGVAADSCRRCPSLVCSGVNAHTCFLSLAPPGHPAEYKVVQREQVRVWGCGSRAAKQPLHSALLLLTACHARPTVQLERTRLPTLRRWVGVRGPCVLPLMHCDATGCLLLRARTSKHPSGLDLSPDPPPLLP